MFIQDIFMREMHDIQDMQDMMIGDRDHSCRTYNSPFTEAHLAEGTIINSGNERAWTIAKPGKDSSYYHPMQH